MPQEQEQRRTQRKTGGGGADPEAGGQTSATAKGEKLKGEMDELLEEIDTVLEENAEEFIKSYVQKGGQ